MKNVFHVPPGMIKQLVLVLGVFKAVRAHIKIGKACHSNTLHLLETLITVNKQLQILTPQIYLNSKLQASDNLLLPSHQCFLYF